MFHSRGKKRSAQCLAIHIGHVPRIFHRRNINLVTAVSMRRSFHSMREEERCKINECAFVYRSIIIDLSVVVSDFRDDSASLISLAYELTSIALPKPATHLEGKELNFSCKT